MNHMIECLIKDGILSVGVTIYYHSDGVAKQYRCATTLNFLSILVVTHESNISRANGAPVHQKEGLIKYKEVTRFLIDITNMIQLPEKLWKYL